jgi:hypothetical protein
MTMELTTIAAVVIGGVALTGGQGYVLGAFFGVLILSLIQSLILYQGQLSSWWTSIFIGLLMLLFIGVQSVLATINARGLARTATGRRGARGKPWRDRRLWAGAGVVIGRRRHRPVGPLDQARGSVEGAAWWPRGPASRVNPARRRLRACGPTVRSSSPEIRRLHLRDQLYGIFPDGRVVGGRRSTSKHRWSRISCPPRSQPRRTRVVHRRYVRRGTTPAASATYSVTVTSGETKTIGAVDGGTDAPAKYWLVRAGPAVLPRSTGAP